MPLLLYGKDLGGIGSINGVLKSDKISIKGGGGVGFQRDGEKKDHPCPKPENIMHKIVVRFTTPNSIVLDPFMGSGTTGVAAVKIGRQFIGIEIEEKYFDIACRRIEEAVRQPDMFIEKPKAAVQIDLLAK
jgi:DNA modification methylase